MKNRMCTCAVYCPRCPYHERACCDQDCDCWCHERERKVAEDLAYILRHYALEEEDMAEMKD
jgi:hypothetical protein